MMMRKMPRVIAGLVLALVAGAAPLACGGGSGDEDMGGAPNDEDGSGGGDTDGSGGGDTDGSGGDTDGSGGESDGGEPGSGGTTAADASIDDLITAICEWEFGCCNAGELTYRLGTAGSSVEECVQHFSFHYAESNTTSNPFPVLPPAARTASGLLGTLAYTVEPDYVLENAEGIADCIAEYEDMECPTDAEPATFCSEPVEPGTSACSLVNLFIPQQGEGDRCTEGLSEGDGNDVECVAGTTCVPGGADDNPEAFDACVQRGMADDPCTEDNDCDYNFYCDPSGDCTEKGDEGDDCTFNDEDPAIDDEDAGCKAGLKCDPDNLICVNNCSLNYPCTLNTECPEDHVCAPVTISGQANVWHQCLPTGESASDRCDPGEDADCADDYHCNASNVCAEDVVINEDCTKNEMCEEGSFCFNNPLASDGYTASGATLTCEAFLQAADPCYYPSTDPAISSGCGPDAPLCLSDDTGLTWVCTEDLKGEGDPCVIMPTSECQVGLTCEMDSAGDYVCSAGVGIDDDCDADPATSAEQDCGVGLTCDVDVCIEQIDPGEDCEDPDNAGAGKASLCKNEDCIMNWDENGPDWVCTDAPVPEANGGNDLTCGG